MTTVLIGVGVYLVGCGWGYWRATIAAAVRLRVEMHERPDDVYAIQSCENCQETGLTRVFALWDRYRCARHRDIRAFSYPPKRFLLLQAFVWFLPIERIARRRDEQIRRQADERIAQAAVDQLIGDL